MSFEVQEALREYLCQFVTPRRLALFNEVLAARTRYLQILLDGVTDTGDACAVMRSCDCFGIQEMAMLGSSNFRPSKGIAVGASKWIDLHHVPHERQAYLTSLHERGFRVVGYRQDDASTPLDELSLDRPFALVLFGAEGPSSEVLSAVDTWVRLPTVGFTRSFNLSVNAAACMATVTRRLRESEQSWQLTRAERNELSLQWLAKMPKRIGLHTRNFLEAQGLDLKQLAELVSSKTYRLLLGQG